MEALTIKSGFSSGNDYTEECVEKISSKCWKEPTAKAMRMTSVVFDTLKDCGIPVVSPIVGVLGGALKIGSSLLDPIPTNADLLINVRRIQKDVQSSFENIARDMKRIQSDINDIKQVTIELRYVDGIEKVNAYFETFIDGARNLELALSHLEGNIFDLQSVAKKSLNPKKVESYFNVIKDEKTISEFQKAFSYVAATKARYLQLMCTYYIFKNDTDRVGQEFETFNSDFHTIFDMYQAIVEEILASSNTEGKFQRDIRLFVHLQKKIRVALSSFCAYIFTLLSFHMFLRGKA